MYLDFVKPDTTVTNVRAINNSISNILMTRKGSVPGKPDFGSNIWKVVFSQIDYATELFLRETIMESLVRYEPRIRINSIDIKSMPEYNRINVSIDYNFTEDGVEQNATASINLNQ